MWVGVDETPVEFANQFLIQSEAEEIILSFGVLTPPVILGTPEDKTEQARAMRFVQTRTLARFGTTVHRLREIVRLYADFLKAYDEQREKR